MRVCSLPSSHAATVRKSQLGTSVFTQVRTGHLGKCERTAWAWCSPSGPSGQKQLVKCEFVTSLV